MPRLFLLLTLLGLRWLPSSAQATLPTPPVTRPDIRAVMGAGAQSRTGYLLQVIFHSDEVMQPKVLTDVMTPTGSVQFGSAPPAVGKAAVAKALLDFYSTIRGMKHRLKHLYYNQRNTIVYEADVTYTRLSGGTLTLPYVCILTTQNGLLASHHIFVDLRPLLAAK